MAIKLPFVALQCIFLLCVAAQPPFPGKLTGIFVELFTNHRINGAFRSGIFLVCVRSNSARIDSLETPRTRICGRVTNTFLFSPAIMASNLTHFNRTSSVFYSCFDDDLSDTEVTLERWTTPDPQSSLTTGIVLLIYLVLGIPFSLFLIISILWRQLYKQPIHIVFMALATNDLFVCLTYFPINVISAFAGEFIFGTNDVTRCHVCMTGVIYVIFTHLNLFLVALLSLDRFLYIKFPLKYPELVKVKSTIAITIITGVFCVVISIPPLFGFGEIRFAHSISTCSLYLLGNGKLTKKINYEIFSIVISLSGPGAILVVTNVWMLFIAQKYLKSRFKSTSKEKYPVKAHQHNKAKNKKQLHLVKVFTVILIVNLVTWFPAVLNAATLLALNNNFVSIPHWFFVANYLLFSSQVFLHPLLQAYLISDIHDFYKKVISRKFLKRQQDIVREPSSNMSRLDSA